MERDFVIIIAHSFDLHIQIKFLAIRQHKFIWSLKEELSGVKPKAVVMSK